MLKHKLPRRRLLKLFVKSGSLLGAGLLGSQMSGCGDRASPHSGQGDVYKTGFGNLLVLNQDRASALYAFAEACVPNSRDQIRQAQVLPRIDEELYFVSTQIREDFLLALDVLEYLPLVYGFFSRFTRLNLPERERFLRGLQNTRINTVSAVISACRMAVMMMYYGHDSTWNDIHYDGTFARLPQIESAQRAHYRRLTKGSESI